MTRSTLVIAPHPDDEILGAGAMMARAMARGEKVAVVVLTDGSHSDPSVAPAALADRRRGECLAGLEAMVGAPVPVLFLAEPDGYLSSATVVIAAESAFGRFVADAAADTIVVTDPADGHPDHKAAFGLASRLIATGLANRLLVMPVGQRIDATFDAGRFDEYPVDGLSDRKIAAIVCHRSQTGGGGGGFSLSPEVIASFAQAEYFNTAYDSDDSNDDAVDATHFDTMFTASSDPWGYDTEPYERDRFFRTIHALSGRRYRAALELGCANGALSEQLAPLCDNLLATDASETALAVARDRIGSTANIELRRCSMPDQMPAGDFDLIVASDMLYYLGLEGVASLMDELDRAATSDGRILLASFLGQTDTRLTGEMASETAIAHLTGWTVRHAERTDRLRIDVLERR